MDIQDRLVVTSDSNIILTDIEGTFLAGEPLTSQPYRQLKEDLGAIKLETGDFLINENAVVENGLIQTIDTTRPLYKVKPDDSFADKFQIPSLRR